ncbi:hypothetical protein MLD38_000706 [Melastoma candidum]|uniref:Uncharacterized protein n=1 Tax=Melastoma candidum TaxID=119954 RepID=A0ACB9SJK2_9MYRT|nr:hypothetical protein MLD38_000706 [Melastoma candidum]
MGQIVRRKRKGRPPKPDLSRRSPSPPPEEVRNVRRSHRRRNVRYSSFIDYDDFIDDDDFELDREGEEVLCGGDDDDGDVELRRGRKVKLVVKLNRRRGAPRRRARETCDSGSEAGDGVTEGEEEVESGSEGRVLKKRRISGREEEDDDLDDTYREGDYGDVEEEDEEEDSGRKGNSKAHESPPGMPSESMSEVPFPDKKTLELILDKLQKKDIYGVYAEPVDPEELPDYHDIIEKPMDFSTVRKKLANGSYTTLNEFESDVFLICTNAMKYNAADTVYHKQARNIQDLGRKKFLKLRIKYERSLKENKVEHRVVTDNESPERDIKSDQGVKSSPSIKKLATKPFSRPMQEPLSSDFSGGAMPSTAGDLHCISASNQGVYTEKHSVDDGLMDGNAAFAENFSDKAEDVSAGRGFSSKNFRRSCIQDENRRATYNMSSHPAVRSKSIFTTFEGEIRQLVAVGLQAEYSYARSLARFAADLGPVAWKMASQRIEQSLPSECKFGRGWVVEYEPVPTPIIFTQKSSCEFPPMPKTLPRDVFPRKEGTAFKMLALAMRGATHCSAQDARQSTGFHGNPTGSFSSQTMKGHHILNPGSNNRVQHETRAIQQFELNSLPSLPQNSGNATHAPEERIPDNSRVADPRSREATPSSTNNPQPKKSESMLSKSRESTAKSVTARQTLPFAQFDINGTTGKVPNGKVPKNGLDAGRTAAAPCSTAVSTKMPVSSFFFPRQDQGLSDPVQTMRLLSEKAQRQQTPSSPADNQRTIQNVSSVRDASGNVSAAGSWMTFGTGGIKQSMHNVEAQTIQAISQLQQYHANPQQPAVVRGGEFPVSSGVQFQSEKNGLHFRGLVQNPAFTFNEACFHPQALFSAQATPADLSRFQPQSHWRGVSPLQTAQHRLKQDTLPPDLNIGFQSPASPVKQSPGVMVDSQQPDLALQL